MPDPAPRPTADPDAERILVCVAWPYANGPRHLGHMAPYTVADVFARYQRLRGRRVLMVSGTDEHGTPITYGADQEGVDPRIFADRYNAVITEDLRRLGISYDLFTRTTTRNHYRVTQELFRTLYAKGYIAAHTQLGAFSPSTGRTLPDRYIEGTCPICGYAEARGDQCDNCGNQLDPTDLINPRSRVNGETPEFRETEHFFIELPRFADQLQAWIAAQRHWRTNVRQFSLALAGDLKPRAITRDLDWGVPVPLPGWEDDPHKKIYVWFDAVIGYLSASIEWARAEGDPEAWKAWWLDPSVPGYYFMGKDNITFHTVIWPAILLGEGDLNLPYDVPSTEFLTMEGRQLSTSRGHVILVRDFLERYDPDPLRYFLSVAGPENHDADFTWAEFIRRNNDELVANWGNLVNRTLVNAQRNFGGVPEPGPLLATDTALLDQVAGGFDSVGALLHDNHFRAGIQEGMRLSALVNQYLTQEEPWLVVKRDRERAGTALYVALQCVNHLKTILSPFLPFTAQRLHEMLGYRDVLAPMPEIEEVGGDDPHRVITGSYPEGDRWHPATLEAGRPLPKPRALYRKLDPALAEEELRRMTGEGTPGK
ncbi:MAG: methionine--tRNA ligase [Candidatus Dormibacteraeota bacterium]|nr:methionine--tRNA ligase [Candidatus Dormibacteraeota bacterium]